MCGIWNVVSWILNAYVLLMLVYAVVSWVPNLRGRWSEYIAMLVEPVLTPVRRIIPPIGGFDLAFLAVVLLIQVVNSQIVRPNMFASCYYGG